MKRCRQLLQLIRLLLGSRLSGRDATDQCLSIAVIGLMRGGGDVSGSARVPCTSKRADDVSSADDLIILVDSSFAMPLIS